MEPITFLNLVILNPKNPYILKLQLEKLGPAFLKVCSEELRDVLWRHGSVVKYIWETSYSLEPPPILYSIYFLQSHHQYWHIKSSEKFCSKWTCLTLLNLRFCKIICALNFLPQLFNLCDTYWPSLEPTGFCDEAELNARKSIKKWQLLGLDLSALYPGTPSVLLLWHL